MVWQREWLPVHAPAPARSETPDQLAEEPQTPRVQICRVVINERFSKAFSGVHYRKMFAAAERCESLAWLAGTLLWSPTKLRYFRLL
jgi:hypothetical protein